MNLEQLAEQYPVVAQLQARNAELEQQNHWFRKQLFGRKSEKRLFPEDPRQLTLGESFENLLPQATETVKSYQRRTTQQLPNTDEAAESLLRFDSTVPVQTVEILPDEVKDLPESAYEVVAEKVTHRLAQRPGAYVVLKYVRKVVKLKSEELKCAPAPASVLERSLADVSFLAGILIDKFLYHLPLYRQHQRLQASGITLSRVTLTNYVHRAVELLSCIYYSQLSSILQSSVLLMDETPVKAGRPPERGKLKQG
jgi:transposase